MNLQGNILSGTSADGVNYEVNMKDNTISINHKKPTPFKWEIGNIPLGGGYALVNYDWWNKTVKETEDRYKNIKFL